MNTIEKFNLVSEAITIDSSRTVPFVVHQHEARSVSLHYDLRLYEAYTEVWAEIINIIFICVNKYKGHVFNMEKIIKSIEKQLVYQQIFSVTQCVKVLKHYNLTYRELYENTKIAERKRMKYKENTNIFSYYVLKCILLFYYNEFVDWCYDHNSSIAFKNTQETINSLIKFIKERYNKADLLKCIDMNSDIQTTDTLIMSISDFIP